MTTLWKESKPLADDTVLPESDLVGMLKNAADTVLIEKAEMLAECTDIGQAEQTVIDRSVGLLALFSASNDMEKAKESCPEIPSARDFSQLQNVVRLALLEIQKDESSTSFTAAKDLFLKTRAELNEMKNVRTAKQSEYRRAVTALKGLRTTDAWLSKENIRQINKVTAMEREVRDFTDGRHKEEKKTAVYQAQLEQLKNVLLETEVKQQNLNDRILTIQQDLSELSAYINMTNRVFQHAKWQESKDLKEQKSTELKTLEDARMDTEQLLKQQRQEKEDLNQSIYGSQIEVQRLERAKTESAKNLIKERQGYASGEKMYGESQDRIHELEKRIRSLEAPLAQSGLDYAEAARHELPTAAALVKSFIVSSSNFQKKIEDFLTAESLEQSEDGMVTAALFLLPGLMVSGSKAASSFSSLRSVS
ncbi:MAG: hypothetical protein EOM64_00570 [Erysipelotrichia bacterium]|nr:hypothetical protein [Erysipelotrichia bacterium]